ncbi:MAG: hypothetical protein P4L43_02315 [Syntrophobacteraceae bacterium]|nr:hypothetical protein [Syntrophobacteraceae bacterium]
MNSVIQCAHCGGLFAPNLRVKNQQYCGGKDCQLARKRNWQKEKLKTDPAYKTNQKDCQADWQRETETRSGKRNGDQKRQKSLRQLISDDGKRKGHGTHRIYAF